MTKVFTERNGGVTFTETWQALGVTRETLHRVCDDLGIERKRVSPLDRRRFVPFTMEQFEQIAEEVFRRRGRRIIDRGAP